MNDPRRELFGNANFRWLLGGGLLSMLGDQFTLLALPWLVMSLSNDPLVLGTVLALGSLPRAVSSPPTAAALAKMREPEDRADDSAGVLPTASAGLASAVCCMSSKKHVLAPAHLYSGGRWWWWWVVVGRG